MKTPAQLIFLDSNQLFGHYFLRSIIWKYLQKYCEIELARVVIPDVVIEETTANYVKAAAKAVSDAQRLSDQLSRLSPTGSSIAIQPPAALHHDQYSSQLREILRREFPGFDIATSASVSSLSIASMAAKEQQPFFGNGKSSFRDAIIWECIKCYVADNPGVPSLVFITNNSKDFWIKSGEALELKLELRQELHGLGFPEMAVFSFVGDFLESVVYKAIGEAKDLQVRLGVHGSQEGAQIDKIIRQNLQSISNAMTLCPNKVFPFAKSLPPTATLADATIELDEYEMDYVDFYAAHVLETEHGFDVVVEFNGGKECVTFELWNLHLGTPYSFRDLGSSIEADVHLFVSRDLSAVQKIEASRVICHAGDLFGVFDEDCTPGAYQEWGL